MRAYRGNIWRFFVVQGLIHFLLWIPIWVVFLQDKGVSLTQIGVLESVAWVLSAGLEVPSGAIADRWGRKASMAIGTFLYSMAMLLILADALSPMFLLGYALWNTSFAFISGADTAFLYDSLKADGRASLRNSPAATSRSRRRHRGSHPCSAHGSRRSTSRSASPSARLPV